MRILVVSPHYYPRVSPRSFRWQSLCEQLVKRGHEVDVVTNKVDNCKDYEEINRVNVNRVGLKLNNSGGLKKGAKENDRVKGKLVKRMHSSLKVIYQLSWKKVYWPDNGIINYPFYQGKLRELVRRKKYDYVIGVGLPFTSILLAYQLAKKYSIELIVDIGDPFADSYLNNQEINNTVLYKKLNQKAEKRIFSYAKAVFVTNDNIERLYKKKYRLKNVFVLPPIFLYNNQFTTSNSGILKREKNTKVNLVFIGSLNSNIRNPEGFLSKMSEYPSRERVVLHFIGNLNDCEDILSRYQEKLNIKVYGRLSKEQCDKAMKEADILINIGNNNSIQLPSKLADYVASKSKIINYSFIEDDLSINYLEYYPYTFLIKHGKKIDFNLLSEFIFNTTVREREVERFIEKLKDSSSANSLCTKLLNFMEE